jgi:hypothetical protein
MVREFEYRRTDRPTVTTEKTTEEAWGKRDATHGGEEGRERDEA